MKFIDCEILVQKLIPPMGGGKNFFAILQFIVIETPAGSERLTLDLGETYGKTENEARSKMQAKLDQWRRDHAQ